MQLTEFIKKLETANIAYNLDRVRDAVMVVVVVPGERWEVEFMDEGGVEVEVFRSDGSIQDETSLSRLFEVHGD